MKNVSFVSRHSFINMLYLGTIDCRRTACISISCTPEEQYEMHNHITKTSGLLNSEFLTDDILTLNFLDNESGITDSDAQRITKFIEANKDKDFLIHCFVGVSRSGAVAKFINEYLELDIQYLNDYTLYNTYVFNKLNAAVGRDIGAYYAELERQDRPNFSW